MSEGERPLPTRALRISAILIACGLLVELLTVGRGTSLSFLAFATIGGTALAAGVVVYLWSIVK